MASGRRGAAQVARKSYDQIVSSFQAIGAGDPSTRHRDGSTPHTSMHQNIRDLVNNFQNNVASVDVMGTFNWVAAYEAYIAELDEDNDLLTLSDYAVEELYNLREWVYLIENFASAQADAAGDVLCFTWFVLSDIAGPDKAELKEFLLNAHPA